jgi:hypothetical protein
MMGNEAEEDFMDSSKIPFFQIAVKNTYNQGFALELVSRISSLFHAGQIQVMGKMFRQSR